MNKYKLLISHLLVAVGASALTIGLNVVMMNRPALNRNPAGIAHFKMPSENELAEMKAAFSKTHEKLGPEPDIQAIQLKMAEIRANALKLEAQREQIDRVMRNAPGLMADNAKLKAAIEAAQARAAHH